MQGVAKEKRSSDRVKFPGNERSCSQAILDALPFYVMLVDEDHHIAAANQAAYADLGELPADLCGQFCPRLVHGVDAYPGCPLEEAIALQQPVETELEDKARGKMMSSGMYPTRLLDDQGRPLYLHFTRDITAQKIAEQALSDSLEHHKALGALLSKLQRCQRPEEVLEELVVSTTALSWMGDSTAAAGFLYRDGGLSLVASRNLDPEIRRRCARVEGQACLCSRVAISGKTLVLSVAELNQQACHESQHLAEHGHATVPLVYERRTLGVLNFYLRPEQTLSPQQLSYLEAAAGVSATALAEQLAREEARQAREEKLLLERRLLERVLASQEEERRRVSRELHDDLGQALSALLLEIRAEDGCDATGTGGFRKRMEGSIRALIDKVSTLAWELRPAILDDYGLPSAVARFAERLAEISGLDIDFQYVCPEELEARLDPKVEVVLYRITQESLHNVMKHADARRVSVILMRQPGAVTLLVEDDGKGFDVQEAQEAGSGRCLGLLGIQERVTLLRGSVRIDSAAGRGTAVKATIPIEREARSDT